MITTVTTPLDCYEETEEPLVVAGDILCDSPEPPELIYALVDPSEPDRVRYVGRTMSPVARYLTHCRAKGCTGVVAWRDEMGKLGRHPMMILLERYSGTNAHGREGSWILHYREIGQADLNRSVPRPYPLVLA